MKFLITALFMLLTVDVTSQEVKEPAKLPLIPYKPSIEGVYELQRISIDTILKNGLKVIVADKSFKVIQFDVYYDCHSRSLSDFSVKRYFGDKVAAEDEYLRKRIWAGDVMDIVNTVIEKMAPGTI